MAYAHSLIYVDTVCISIEAVRIPQFKYALLNRGERERAKERKIEREK